MEENKIYTGNALDLIKKLDNRPHLIIMSPPDLAETDYTLEEYRSFLNTIYNECINKLDINGVLVSITTDRKMKGKIYTKHMDIINAISKKADLFFYKIWIKSLKANLFILNYSHIIGFRKTKKNINNKIKEFYPDAWLIERDKVSGYKTKDSFPSELVRRLVLNFTNEGSLVLDPFVGSGKSARIAKELKRKYIGFELDEENAKIAENHIARLVL